MKPRTVKTRIDYLISEISSLSIEDLADFEIALNKFDKKIQKLKQDGKEAEKTSYYEEFMSKLPQKIVTILSDIYDIDQLISAQIVREIKIKKLKKLLESEDKKNVEILQKLQTITKNDPKFDLESLSDSQLAGMDIEVDVELSDRANIWTENLPNHKDILSPATFAKLAIIAKRLSPYIETSQIENFSLDIKNILARTRQTENLIRPKVTELNGVKAAKEQIHAMKDSNGFTLEDYYQKQKAFEELLPVSVPPSQGIQNELKKRYQSIQFPTLVCKITPNNPKPPIYYILNETGLTYFYLDKEGKEKSVLVLDPVDDAKEFNEIKTLDAKALNYSTPGNQLPLIDQFISTKKGQVVQQTIKQIRALEKEHTPLIKEVDAKFSQPEQDFQVLIKKKIESRSTLKTLTSLLSPSKTKRGNKAEDSPSSLTLDTTDPSRSPIKKTSTSLSFLKRKDPSQQGGQGGPNPPPNADNKPNQ